MEIVLIIISLILNLTTLVLIGFVLRALGKFAERMGEHDSTVVAANSGVRQLTKELVTRLPPRAYGSAEREPELMLGPSDQRIPR